MVEGLDNVPGVPKGSYAMVTKVHHEVRRMSSQGYDIIYVGHAGHDEAVGAIAEAPEAVTLVDPDEGLGEAINDRLRRAAKAG